MMTENTIHYSSRCLIDLLHKNGVTDAVACPGSRNTPLLIALSRCREIRTTMVVDERVAGFVALGMVAHSGRPVALCCTSGTALLNFAPSVAEAYYRKLPLIVVSADRPCAWIDQDDSQTLRQYKVIDNIVKGSYDIPTADTDELRWYANRVINDALITASLVPQGPVHINIQIGEPIGTLQHIEYNDERSVAIIKPREDMSVADSRLLGMKLASPRKVMIIAGVSRPDDKVNKALNRLSQLPNFVILTESVANVHGENFISEIDVVLSSLDQEEHSVLAPDVVITIGGALISRFLKEYMRGLKNVEHWIINNSLTTVDCFKHLQLRIEMQPEVFLPQLASAMQPHRTDSDYRRRWIIARDRSRSILQSYSAKAPWSDLKAFSVFMPLIPRNVDLHLSNGTSVRYAQLFAYYNFHRCDCNRGVSGIDGSTSTALGASIVSKGRIALLITGDMSAQYDVGALFSGLLTPSFKMIVMCNGGGGIFHFIKSTYELDIVNECFDAPCHFPAEQIASAAGMSFFKAESEAELRLNFASFITESRRPAMMAIYTSGEISGEILRNLFNQNHYKLQHPHENVENN